jgi:ribonucleoside-diphosphate reductase alpha chain
METAEPAIREHAVPAPSAAARDSAADFALTPPHNPGQMRVTKRNGSQETVDVNKIVKAVTRTADGLHGVDPMRVALKTIGGLYDGATTQELDQLSIRTAAALTAEEPEYGQLAARLLSAFIDKEVSGQEIQSFSQSIALGSDVGILNARLRDFVALNARKLNDAIDPLASRRFEYFGLRTV